MYRSIFFILATLRRKKERTSIIAAWGGGEMARRKSLIQRRREVYDYRGSGHRLAVWRKVQTFHGRVGEQSNQQRLKKGNPSGKTLEWQK